MRITRCWNRIVRRNAWLLPGVCLVGVLACPAPAGGAAEPVPETAGPAEERHFERSKFLIGLRREGLFDLQAEYMRRYPPRNPAEQSWYQREQQLAEALKPDVPMDRRLEYFQRADAAAAKAIQAEPNSVRSLLWRADRAETWLEQAARPYFEQVLFFGPTESDTKKLRDCARRAAAAFDEAIAAVQAYLERLETGQGGALAREAERVGLNAYSMLRRLRFGRCWALLQQALGTDRTDVEQGLLVGEVLRCLQEAGLLERRSDQSGLRVQALFMAAVASRLQADWPSALSYLQKALQVLEALPEPQRRRLEWIGFAVQVERVRMLLDQGYAQRAMAAARNLQAWLDRQRGLTSELRFARRLSAAMLEFEAISLAATTAAAEGNLGRRDEYAARRFESLARLARDWPDYRRHIYRLVAERLGKVTEVAKLPAFGRVAYAADMLRQGKFAEALAAAQSVEQDTSAAAQRVRPDAIYFQAISLQRLGQAAAAAEAFWRLARDFPKDKRAKDALLNCLYLLAESKAVASEAGRRTFLEAGERLLRGWPAAAQQHGWVLPIAEATLQEGRYARAVELFAMVPRDSDQYPRAVRGRIVAAAGQLRAGQLGPNQQEARRVAEEVIAEAIDFASRLSKTGGGSAATQPAREARLAADVLLAAAELCVDPLGDSARALKILENFEQRYKPPAALLGRLLAVRIQALQKMGRLPETMGLVEKFIAAQPDAAGPVVAALLADMQRAIRQQQRAGRAAEARAYAAMAIQLAERLDEWAAQRAAVISPQQRYAIRLRLAEALLQAGQLQRALKLFDALVAEDAARWDDKQPRDADALRGQADCLFGLGRWVEAREAYLRIWRRSQVRSELWWRCLLRSLQCSAKLGEDPEKILKSIRQHRRLWPDMGGPHLSKQFEQLQLELIRRTTTKPAGATGK